MLLAETYQASTFPGSDYHEGSIELARKRAAEEPPAITNMPRSLRLAVASVASDAPNAFSMPSPASSTSYR